MSLGLCSIVTIFFCCLSEITMFFICFVTELKYCLIISLDDAMEWKNDEKAWHMVM